MRSSDRCPSNLMLKGLIVCGPLRVLETKYPNIVSQPRSWNNGCEEVKLGVFQSLIRFADDYSLVNKDVNYRHVSLSHMFHCQFVKVMSH